MKTKNKDCVICGLKPGTIEIKDPHRFAPPYNLVCRSCFELWSAGKDEEIYKIIKQKLCPNLQK